MFFDIAFASLRRHTSLEPIADFASKCQLTTFTTLLRQPSEDIFISPFTPYASHASHADSHAAPRAAATPTFDGATPHCRRQPLMPMRHAALAMSDAAQPKPLQPIARCRRQFITLMPPLRMPLRQRLYTPLTDAPVDAGRHTPPASCATTPMTPACRMPRRRAPHLAATRPRGRHYAFSAAPTPAASRQDTMLMLKRRRGRGCRAATIGYSRRPERPLSLPRLMAAVKYDAALLGPGRYEASSRRASQRYCR